MQTDKNKNTQPKTTSLVVFGLPNEILDKIRLRFKQDHGANFEGSLRTIRCIGKANAEFNTRYCQPMQQYPPPRVYPKPLDINPRIFLITIIIILSLALWLGTWLGTLPPLFISKS